MITFTDLANEMEMTKNQAKVTLSLPPVTEKAIEKRATSFAQLVLKQNLCHIKDVTGNTKVRTVECMINDDEVIVLIKFNAAPVHFPMKFPVKLLTGNEKKVMRHLQEYKLVSELYKWKNLTDNGWRFCSSGLKLLEKMQYFKNTQLTLSPIGG